MAQSLDRALLYHGCYRAAAEICYSCSEFLRKMRLTATPSDVTPTAVCDPTPEEIYAIIEIADTSLRKDTGVKLQLDGRYRIPDYLVADLNEGLSLHYSHAHGIGYGRVRLLSASDSFVLERLPGVQFKADAFFR